MSDTLADRQEHTHTGTRAELERGFVDTTRLELRGAWRRARVLRARCKTCSLQKRGVTAV